MAIDLADFAALEAFLRRRLKEPLPGPVAHGRFAPRPPRDGWQPGAFPSHARRAATLVLLYPDPRGAVFPLTIRHGDLPHHPGQVSLPGGRIDLDESAEHAALRESHEEIGVTPDRVRILGALSPLWITVSNHVIQPFVGVADARPDFRLAAREVAALLEAPLADLGDAEKVGQESRVRDGVPVEIPFFSLQGHRVWGATAMILSEIRELVLGAAL